MKTEDKLANSKRDKKKQIILIALTWSVKERGKFLYILIEVLRLFKVSVNLTWLLDWDL